VPELEIAADRAQRGMHSAYNMRVFAYDADFEPTGKLKVLVVGNSFSRDWANVLLESRYGDGISLSYIADARAHADLTRRMKEADVIFYSRVLPSDVPQVDGTTAKLWVVGTKSFGASNGIFYNHRGDDYYAQRTPLEEGVMAQNEALERDWGGR